MNGLRPGLNEAALRRLALDYVARYATSSGRLLAYLKRKLRERGWEGDSPPDVESLVSECVARHYVNDLAFAENRAAGLMRKGLGARRVQAGLLQAGVPQSLAQAGSEDAREKAFELALIFARRRKIGPFSQRFADDRQRARWIAQMARAGHSGDDIRRVLALSAEDAESGCEEISPDG